LDEGKRLLMASKRGLLLETSPSRIVRKLHRIEELHQLCFPGYVDDYPSITPKEAQDTKLQFSKLVPLAITTMTTVTTTTTAKGVATALAHYRVLPYVLFEPTTTTVFFDDNEYNQRFLCSLVSLRDGSLLSCHYEDIAKRWCLTPTIDDNDEHGGRTGLGFGCVGTYYGHTDIVCNCSRNRRQYNNYGFERSDSEGVEQIDLWVSSHYSD